MCHLIHTIIYFPPLVFSLFRWPFPQPPTHQLQAAGAFSGFQRINWESQMSKLWAPISILQYFIAIFGKTNFWQILVLVYKKDDQMFMPGKTSIARDFNKWPKKLNLLNLNEQIHLNLLNLNKSFGAGRATSVGKTSIAKGTRTVFAEMAKECEKI